MRTSTSSM